MNKPKSLYIHIPFCKYICSYCDFPKLQYFSHLASSYLSKLIEELVSYEIGELETIYVGGGTPTSLSEEELEILLKAIYPYIKNIKEYTFEANPDSLNINKIKLLKQYRVNRISIGVESTDDNVLKMINRHHNYQDVVDIIRLLKENGFNNINVDLILGLPHVSKKMIEKDIDNLINLDVQHISCYSLTVHPHTKFYIDGINEPEEGFSRELYDLVNERLNKAGFIHYEISNWSKPHYYSLHNLTYWNNDRYYAVGMGASGYIDNVRYKNTLSINHYLNGNIIVEKEIITKTDDINYQIMLNLRTIFGLDLNLFKNKFDIDLLTIKKEEIDELMTNNLLKIENNHLIPTYNGMMLLDQILVKLFL